MKKMKNEEKHQRIRELLMDKIQKTGSPLKPSMTELKKMSDDNLVDSLNINSILAEK